MVWQDARALGKAAGNIAAMLAGGQKMSDIKGAVKWSGGEKGVEMNSMFLRPIPITKDDLNIVIEAGWIAKDKACAGAKAGVKGC